MDKPRSISIFRNANLTIEEKLMPTLDLTQINSLVFRKEEHYESNDRTHQTATGRPRAQELDHADSGQLATPAANHETRHLV